MKEKKRKGKDL